MVPYYLKHLFIPLKIILFVNCAVKPKFAEIQVKSEVSAAERAAGKNG